MLNRNFGLAEGFDRYLENFRPGLWYKTAAEVNRDAFSLIGELKGRKSFIWIHYSDPHEPYFPRVQRKIHRALRHEPLYSGPSIEQPVLRLALVLQPGENIVRLNTEVPFFLNENHGFLAVSYADLQVKPLDPGADIAMSFPGHGPPQRALRAGHGQLPKAQSFADLDQQGKKGLPGRAGFQIPAQGQRQGQDLRV